MSITPHPGGRSVCCRADLCNWVTPGESLPACFPLSSLASRLSFLPGSCLGPSPSCFLPLALPACFYPAPHWPPGLREAALGCSSTFSVGEPASFPLPSLLLLSLLHLHLCLALPLLAGGGLAGLLDSLLGFWPGLLRPDLVPACLCPASAALCWLGVGPGLLLLLCLLCAPAAVVLPCCEAARNGRALRPPGGVGEIMSIVYIR
jgi:hypothetical protein